MSSVRRPSSQRDYLREVSKQTTIMNLQGQTTPIPVHSHRLMTSQFTIGFLFFGTIVSVEECIRDLIEGASWNRNPVRFLVLDLSMAAGIDMSAAEAFVRVHRLVMAKHVILVFCGFDSRSDIGQALETVNVLGANGVELFANLNDALECEFPLRAVQVAPELISFFVFCRDGKCVPQSLVPISQNGNLCVW